jgi:hypothetical protein
MKNQLIENNYLIIDNFIDPDRAKGLYKLFKDDSQKYPNIFQHDEQCPKSLALYDWRWFVELLVEKCNFMSEIMQEPMLPTYSYARVYANGEVLKKHKDRPACEISVTCHLDSDGTDWEIYFTKPNGQEVSAILKPGQAVIYLGCLSEHWREAFTGEHYGQVFLHYVRSRAENWDCYFDKSGK